MLIVTKGSRIKELRLSNGYTQTELAKKIGVSTQLIFKYEKEIITNIPISTIEKLSEVFGVSPACLMEWSIDDIPTGSPMSEVRKDMIDTIMVMTDEELQKISCLIDIIRGGESKP
jgi:transcriptional regulator with XRE-family HTH domain